MFSRRSSWGATVGLHDGVEKLKGLSFLSLKRISSDNGAKPASVADRGYFVEDRAVSLGWSAGKNHDAAAVEGALHDVTHALGQCADGNLFFLVNLARRFLFDVGARQLHFNDVRAKLRRDVGRVTAHVDAGLALFA